MSSKCLIASLLALCISATGALAQTAWNNGTFIDGQALHSLDLNRNNAYLLSHIQAGGLSVGTSQITGGVNGYLLFNNGGILGNIPIGTSGASIPLLNGINTFSGDTTFSGSGNGVTVNNNIAAGSISSTGPITMGGQPVLSSVGNPQSLRRNKLSFTLGAYQASKGTLNAGSIYTNNYAVFLEAPAYAIKIGVSNPYNSLFSIQSMSVYMSDSYSDMYIPGGMDLSTASNSGRIHMLPSANSVYLTCTTTSGSQVVTCPGGTGTISSVNPVYVDGTGVSVIGNPTVTITNSTTVTMNMNATANGSTVLHFYNLAPECKLYFDNGGADVNTINNAGVSRTVSITGTSSTTFGPYTFAWSDFSNCSTVPRADGGRGYIAFVYVTQAASTVAYGYQTGMGYYFNQVITPLIGGSKFLWMGHAWSGGGTDYADNPTGSNWGNTSVSPAIAVSYMTTNPGFQGLQLGDSLSVAGSATVAGAIEAAITPEWIAAHSLSTNSAPIELFNTAWGGTAWSTYGLASQRNIGAVQPSFVIGQPMTRNEPGGATLANYQYITAQILGLANNAVRTSSVRIGLRGAFPFTTTIDGNASAISQWNAMRATIASLATGVCSDPICPDIATYDPIPIVSAQPYGGNAYDYASIGKITSSGSVAAGGTAIAISGWAINPCYVGYVLTDITTPAALSSTPSNCALTSSSSSSLGVGSSCIVGSGIQASDSLQCSASGYSGGAESVDNTHPALPSSVLLLPTVTTFIKQLTGQQ